MIRYLLRSIAALYIFCNVQIVYAQQPGAAIDILHYEFSLELNDVNDIIIGKAVLDIHFLSSANTITLDFVSKKDNGKGMTVVTVIENKNPLSFTQADNKLTIQLKSATKSGDKKYITIQYSGIPADGLIITNNKYKHRGFFADNWPNRASNWLPCIDHPADKAAVDFIITAPWHYEVIANGIMVQQDSIDDNRKRTHYQEEVPLPTKIMVIGVADFAVDHAGDVNGIPVYSWVYPEDKEKGFYDYAQAVTILPFYIKNVGPYAYKKLANVQSKTRFGGLENASAIFYSENSVTGTRRNEGLMAHEIAHQWFGDMATETNWPHLWLSEGFATYMTILYFENKYGTDTATYMLLEDREQVIAFSQKQQRPVVDSSVTDYMQLLNANSYQKGGWVLHMLRQELEDSAFWKSIRLYYERYKGKNANTNDLRLVFEEISGKDLKQFFRQWLYTPGQPMLDITWQYDVSGKKIKITINQQQPTLFQFPLELQVNGISKQVTIKNKQTSLTIPVKSKPQKLIADPQVKLLFEATIKEVN